jgi:hypothetical protein
VLVPKDGKWIVLLCWQKISGGPVHKIGRSAGEIELPKRAFAVIPISDVFAGVGNKIAELVGLAHLRTAGARARARVMGS